MAQWNSKKWARINWKNRPSTATALGATNLNKIDVFLNEVDNQLIDIDASKLNISTANSMITSLTIDVNSGVITAKQLDGTVFTWDLNLEKIPVSFTLSEDGILTMTTEDGTQFTADIGELIKDYTFIDSATVGFTKTAAGSGYNVTAIVKDGSIKEKHLDPDYLSSIQQNMNTAQTAANDSLMYSKDSKRWAVGDSEYEGSETDNSEYYSKLSEAAKVAAEKARDEAQAVSGIEIATTKKAGIVKPDGTTITVDTEDGTISSIIKAASLLITDTQGLQASAGKETTTQLLIDAIADKIANHIVTNEALASQLADYVSKSMISNQAVNDTTKVTGAALSYEQQKELERLNSNLDGKTNISELKLYQNMITNIYNGHDVYIQVKWQVEIGKRCGWMYFINAQNFPASFTNKTGYVEFVNHSNTNFVALRCYTSGQRPIDGYMILNATEITWFT